MILWELEKNKRETTNKTGLERSKRETILKEHKKIWKEIKWTMLYERFLEQKQEAEKER